MLSDLTEGVIIDPQGAFEHTYRCYYTLYTIMTVLLALSLVLAPFLASASHATPKEFTAVDMLSAPRPQAPIPNYEGTQAISVVDNWDPVKDK